MREIVLDTPQVRFHALEEGDGPLVLCLHGFPDHARSFRHQVPALVAAGYRVVVPWMRGYAPTSQPADARYDSMALGEDVVALLDALGAERAAIVGHDWGAVATYFAALLAPARLERIVTMAVPYGPQFLRAFLTSYAQLRRSWYMVFFQRGIADAAVAHDDFAFLEGLWRDWSPGFTCPPEEMEALKATFRRPGTLEAALAYYRQSFGPVLDDPAGIEAVAQGMAAPLAVPALMLHGADDGCIGAELVPPMRDYFPGGVRIEMIAQAGHFLHQERPEGVNPLILEFLRDEGAASARV